MKLYHAPHTRSTRPRWLLEELDVPYDLHRIDWSAKEHKSDAYLRIHPLGQLPALVEEEGPLFESIALCMHLADRHPERGLAPAPGSYDRGLYYQWMLFAATSIEPAILEIFVQQEYYRDDLSWATRAAAARERLPKHLAILEKALEGRDYVLGGFTAADVVLGSLLMWAARMAALEGFPNLQAYVERLRARPAWQRAKAD